MAHQLLSLVRPAASLGKPYPTYVYKTFNAFHATPSTYTQTPSVHPASDKEAFVRGLRASGLSIEQAQGGVPMVLHDIRKALKPWSLPASDLHYDKQKIRDLFRSVQIKGNEPAFMHLVTDEVLPTIKMGHDGHSPLTKHDDMAFEETWKAQPALNNTVRPTLAHPKTDLLQGFRGIFFDKYPLSKQTLGLHMTPIGMKSGLSFPFFSLNAQGFDEDAEVAMLQNDHAAALMLRNLWYLVAKSNFYLKHPPSERAEPIVVLSAILKPDCLTLRCHWMVPDETGGPPTYHWRLVRAWTFPDEFEIASRSLVNAVVWTRRNLEKTIFGDLDRLEQALTDNPSMRETASPSAAAAAAESGDEDVAAAAAGVPDGEEVAVEGGAAPRRELQWVLVDAPASHWLC